VLQNLEEESPQPEETMLDREQTIELQRLINRLDPDYRTPLILRYWEDYSYEQIAAVMALTVPAVKSRLFRARKQMADLVQEAQVAVSPPNSGLRRDAAPRPAAKAQPERPLLFRTALAGV
jgi:RNA polymerase sigma factor (sigma-70 family)